MRRQIRIIQRLASLAALVIIFPATAEESYTVTVPVVSAEPIISTRMEGTPREKCRPVPIERRRHGRHRDDFASTLLGGLIGGAIGRQFGGGSGRDILTAAGALAGAAIANDNRHRDIDHDHPRQRCVVHTDRRKVRVVDGWRVTYLYQGREFTRVMDHRPGARMQLRVEVTPVHDTLVADSRFM